MAELSPMMQNYLRTKSEYSDCILFYRLGDFYEMFFDDAITASKELEITLTGKNCGLEERAPMCGVPHHAVDSYLNKLVSKGYKVAICEQLEDPKTTKGIVKRDVIRVVTPGTNLSMEALDEKKNNYIMCIAKVGDIFGIATCDVSTGDFFVTSTDSLNKVLDEITKFSPAELVANDALIISGIDFSDLKFRLGVMVYPLKPEFFDEERCQKVIDEHFENNNLLKSENNDAQMLILSGGGLLLYLLDTQKTSLTHITKIIEYNTNAFMVLDTSTRRNLELTETLREKQKHGTLLWVLDKTKTAMGARLLRSYIEQPLIKKSEIEHRLDAIDEFNNRPIDRDEIREYLNRIYDLERLISRICYYNASPRDLIAFANSLSMLEPIKVLLKDFNSDFVKEIFEHLDPLKDIKELVENAIVPEPPISVKEGGIIKDGYNEMVDEYKRAKTDGKKWLLDIEEKEKEKTGIKSLKIKYNKVFGYYIEVTNTYKDMVPEEYIRKQTLTNAERFITPELKELEDKILGAQEKLYSLEYELFSDIRKKIAKEVVRVQNTARAVARLDVFASLSYVAMKNDYVRPKISNDGEIDIKNGRHPVVEQMTKSGVFVSNDTYLNNKENRLAIITGPNMAGKSTYMRQVSLIVLMAQIGSFVPAQKAKIAIVDRIFTRVGASDDLASGQSTFMVEMNEVAEILNNATKKSLLILDEIGRGTSTYDGLSIAWAVAEYIADDKKLGAKTLFATHYHELTELEGRLPNVNNYCIAVKEQGDDIIFLRKIIKGGADKSYGIQVAKLAGIPKVVIDRAKEISKALTENDLNKDMTDNISLEALENNENYQQLSLFEEEKSSEMKVADKIRELDLFSLTPIDAINLLNDLKKELS
ncbi:DNA mismatch repair protein MutS [Acetitomaculum ruminis DSM 5522]|uniref:DNA mismatch repair protein MutS n=2 Tax=Acetitomaculum ruminis TaxID=2382 RepID=A0A1I0V579_9FIRM|nr:DNA mismatch repair protein MutS [Acetitomaculum ruminis]SFA71233.1 DNA mismatch repair protein MutS [Acetitomaculum ruminis DSM 5522]